jgi:hypothetical protein
MSIFNKYFIFNNDFFQSILLAFAAVIIPLIAGYIVANLLTKKKNDINWSLFPFLGISVIVLFLQNLVYKDIPIKNVSLYLLIFILLFFIFFVLKKKRKPNFEWILIVAFCLGVFFINGFGYLRETPKWYVGYGWIDQYNYMVTSEFLKEYKYSTTLSQIDTPYLVRSITAKSDRIGQSIYHAFLSSVFNLSSEYTYGAISLLAPLLTFFAFLYMFSLIKIKKIVGYVFSFGAGIVPATSVIHLENFLSQALGTPFLLITVVYILFLNSKKISWRNIIVLGFLIAGTNSIYTEYTPFILIILTIKIILLLFYSRKNYITIFILFASFITAIIMNLGYFDSTIMIFKRTNIPGILANVYPFNHTVYGFSRMYFGDLAPSGNIGFFVITIFVFLLGVLGLILLSLKKKSLNILFLLCFAFGSVILNIVLTNYPYQTYKLMLSLLPLLFLGLGYIGDLIFTLQRSKLNAAIFFSTYSLILLSIPSYSTLKLANVSHLGGPRSNKLVLFTNEQKKLYENLDSLEGKNIFLNTTHSYELARMVYFGRRNHLWFFNPIIGDYDTSILTDFKFTQIQNMPKNVIDIKGITSTYPKISEKLPVHAIVIGAVEGNDGNMWTWLGKTMKMNVYSSEERLITMVFTANMGPSNNDKKRVLRISNLKTKESHELTFYDVSDSLKIKFYVKKGLNEFKFDTLYPNKIERILDSDKRILMIRLNNLAII